MAGESLPGQPGWTVTGLAPGSLVAGYRVEARIGAGGMAMVLRARDEALGRTVALKILVPARAGDAEFRERFVRESRAVAAVDHPHIIPVYAAGEASGVLYLAMRFVAGGDLHSVIKREGPLPGERAVTLLLPIASALDAAHAAGLVHRDVKPANILVDAGPGRPEHPYLSDFGLAKGSASSAGLTGSGQFLGTPDYAAPEQILGRPARPQTDQYALACVMYTALTGSLPFARDESMAVLWAHMYDEPPPLTASRPDLPDQAGRVLARALAKSPDERYATCGDLIDALQDALSPAPSRSSGTVPAGTVSAGTGYAPAGTAGGRRPDGGTWAPLTQTVTPHPSFPPGPELAGPPWEPSSEHPPEPTAPGDASLEANPAVRRRPARRGGARLPVAVPALVALLLLLGGGGFGFWQHIQDRYFVGVQDGYVAVFRGTSQNLAGISLSRLVQRSTLPVSQLRSSDRARLAQTIAPGGGMSGAEGLVGQLQSQVIQCRQQWQAVAAWPARDAKYQAGLAAVTKDKSKGKAKVPAADNPGPRPSAPGPASCAPAPALGVTIPSPSPRPATPAVTVKAAPDLPASAITVDVYNGGTTPGLATSVSQALVARGYKRGAVTDASAQSRAVTAQTQVFYGKGAAASAAKIARYFGAHAAAASPLSAGHVEVLLGTGAASVPAGLAPAQGAPSGGSVSAPPVVTGHTAAPTCGFDANGNYTCAGGANSNPNCDPNQQNCSGHGATSTCDPNQQDCSGTNPTPASTCDPNQQNCGASASARASANARVGTANPARAELGTGLPRGT